jgi:hypothetical protein
MGNWDLAKTCLEVFLLSVYTRVIGCEFIMGIYVNRKVNPQGRFVLDFIAGFDYLSPV